jgi:hypothetical protein
VLESVISIAETERVLHKTMRGWENDRQLRWVLKIRDLQDGLQLIGEPRERERSKQVRDLRNKKRDWKQDYLMFLYH